MEGLERNPNLQPRGLCAADGACLADEAPEGANWIHELKYDGYRAQPAIQPGDLRAYTPRGRDWSHIYRPLDVARAHAGRMTGRKQPPAVRLAARSERLTPLLASFPHLRYDD
jgi:hypothetical protein